MPSPTDPPPGGSRPQERRRRFDDRGRVILITTAVVLVVLILSARLFAGFYVDYLWHAALGRGDVFWGVWRAKLILFLMFAGVFIVLAGLNLVIADRLAPTAFAANTHPLVERFHEFFGHRMRMLRYGVAGILGVLVAIPAVSHWQDWMLFLHARSFGIEDPEFGNDVGFYVFRLPFIAFAIDWLFAVVVLILLLVVATHVLSGGIVIQPPRPRIRNATKAHVAVLLAVLAIIKAGDYWLMRYELTYNTSGVVRGAGYSGIKAHLPAIVLLGLIALLVAGLFLSTLRTNSWRWPLVASALWVVMALVGGVIYPAAVQRLVVNPNKKDRELPFIARNIDGTRHALGIDDVRVVDIDVQVLTEPELSSDADPLRAVRLFNPVISLERFRADEGQRAGLAINDLDVDRYELDGGVQQVIVAARELEPSTIPNKSWQGRHLISTHGCGLVQAPAGQATEGRPVYESVGLNRPELYYSPELDGYAIANTSVTENVCADSDDPGRYGGRGGVRLNSFVRRLAFALDLLDYNVLGSSAINDESRLIINRSVQDRVRTLAPFLSFDGDPYPVALDGRVLWVVDGYTTSNRYPYSESADTSQVTGTSGLRGEFNYVRNSVKAVVDAYDGTVRMFVVDDTDPVIAVWRSAFPKMFEPMSSMPTGLSDHLRYPEDIFRVQTAAYSKYQLDAEAFFDRQGAWSVAQSPAVGTGAAAAATSAANATEDTTAEEVATDFAIESDTDRFVPYYSMFRAPGETEATFQMYRPFVPFSTNDQRKELQAYMMASSDQRTYGDLVAYRVSNENLPDGPATVSATMNSNSALSAEISLLDRGGSQVIFGDMQMVPVAESILWVRPLYVVASGSQQPTLRYVVVAYQSRVAFAESIGEAVGELFPGFDIDLGDNVGGSSDPSAGDDGSDDGSGTDDPGEVTQNPAALLAQADQLFVEADQALQDSDLATYAQKIDAARALVQQAIDLLEVETGTTVPGTDATDSTVPTADTTATSGTTGGSQPGDTPAG